MKTVTDKTSTTKSKAAANTVSARKDTGGSDVQFEDKRLQAGKISQLQVMANGSAGGTVQKVEEADVMGDKAMQLKSNANDTIQLGAMSRVGAKTLKGGITGAAGGSMAGAAGGTAVAPVVGTVAGTAMGAAAGGVIGSLAGFGSGVYDEIAAKLSSKFPGKKTIEDRIGKNELEIDILKHRQQLEDADD
jgi:hypothetical protein